MYIKYIDIKPDPVDLGLFLVVGARWQQQSATGRRELLLLLLSQVMRMN